MHTIMKAVPFIEKDKRNDFHNYEYASEKIIKETLHKHLVAQKILFRLEVIDSQVHDTLLLIKVKYYFTDLESGEELTGEFMGSGEDKGDKALYKAITGAIKYILTSSFLIPTGDDPEKDEQVEKNEKLTLPSFLPNHKMCSFDDTHGYMKYVPSGISKKTGRAYNAFYKCDECNSFEKVTA